MKGTFNYYLVYDLDDKEFYRGKDHVEATNIADKAKSKLKDKYGRILFRTYSTEPGGVIKISDRSLAQVFSLLDKQHRDCTLQKGDLEVIVELLKIKDH